MCRPYGWNGFSHSGRPQGSPLRRFSAAIQNGASRRPRPTKGESLQSGRVRTPAPTADAEASCPFVGAGHWPARGRDFAISEPTLIRLAYARHFLPGREKVSGRLIAAKGSGPKIGRAGEDTRPYCRCGSILSFRRGRTLAGPSNGFCHSGAHPHPPRIRSAPSPWKGEGFRAADSRPYK